MRLSLLSCTQLSLEILQTQKGSVRPFTAGEDCSMGVGFAGNAWISLAKVFGDLKDDIIRKSQDLRLNVCYLNRRIIGIALIKSRKPQMEKI